MTRGFLQFRSAMVFAALFVCLPSANCPAEETPSVVLSPHNLRAPFCYVVGASRSWPIFERKLADDESLVLTARQGETILAHGRQLEFAELSVSVSPDGLLTIESGTNETKITCELEVILLRAEIMVASQRLTLRPAPPSRPISYLADLGDDIIHTFLDRRTGRFRPIVKGAFDQYFRRLQAHGVSRLIVWQTPFPFMAATNNDASDDWARYEKQTRAILENEELSEILNHQSGGLATWTWQRQMIALRLMKEFGPIFTRSASEHGIKLTASFRPFESALTKYYEVPTFDTDGGYLWSYLPLASPKLNYHPEQVCFANYRHILKRMGKQAEAEIASIELTGTENAELLVDRFDKGAHDLKIVASHFPPIAAKSFVLVRNDETREYRLQRYEQIAPRARSQRVPLTGYSLSLGENGSLLISGLKLPAGYRYLIVSRGVEQSESIQSPLAAPVVLRSQAGNPLGRINVYRALPDSDPDGGLTRIAGISATGGYRTTFQTIENSIDKLGKDPSPARLTSSELVFDLGADWSVEMLDFEQPAARKLAVDQLKHLLSYRAFDEILINTRSHCQLGASTADGVDGIKPLAHYRLHAKNYFHLGIDRAFAPISLAGDETIQKLASRQATIEQITTFQAGAWDYHDAYQSAQTPYKWHYHRNLAVARGVRSLLQDLEREFPDVRIRAVIPPGQQVTEQVKAGLDTMTKPEGGLYGRDYYRHLWGTLNHIPAIGEGMAMVDLSGTRIEPVFLGTRFAPAEGPFRLFLEECLKDLADNRGSSYRGPRSFFYEAQETLRSKSSDIRRRREQIICELLARKEEINEVILYEAADWVYHLPLADLDYCGSGFLDRCANEKESAPVEK